MLITFPHCYRIAWDIETDNYDTFSIPEPDAAPQNITALSKTSTSILVTWGEVPKRKRQGRIQSYKVHYTSTTSNETKSEEVQAPTQYLKIDDLERNTNYTITVMASTNKGYGPASEPISVATDQDHTMSWTLCMTFGLGFFRATMKCYSLKLKSR